MREKKLAINPIVATVPFVQMVKSSSVIGSATGFFYCRSDNKTFLITNRHVIETGQSSTNPDLLRLLLHRDPNNLTNNGFHDVPLYTSSGDPLWKDHATQTVADVALVEIDRTNVQSNFFIKCFSSSDFLPTSYVLDPGEDVFIIGYPLGYFDSTHNLPVFRNAMIASVYGVPFHNDPCFLTDANLHPGTSGSPVITKPKSAWVDNEGNTTIGTGNRYYLIGVHSGTKYRTLSSGANVPLGLGVAWYIKIVEDIANSF